MKYIINAASLKSLISARAELDSNIKRLGDTMKRFGETSDAAHSARAELDASRKVFRDMRDTLNTKIDTYQSRAKVRTIDIINIIDAVEESTEYILRLSTKKDAIGTVVSVDPHACRFPSAYKYEATGTGFDLILTPSGFAVTEITRRNCDKGNDHAYTYRFTAETIKNMPDFLSHHR